MELRHCRYFVAVAEELHFGRAARRLGMSQPPLSQQIRRLEEELGVELFRRTKRSVRLTPAGDVFLESARKLLRGAEDAIDVARRAARGEVGTLHVGYAPSVELDILPKVLLAFSKRFPDVELRLTPLATREQLEALRQRQIDVGLVLLPAEGDGLQVARLRREPLVLVASTLHPLARLRSVPLGALQGVPTVQLARSCEPAYHDHLQALARQGKISLRVAAESAHLYDALSLVAAGVGVSLLPDCVRRLRRSGITTRPLLPPGTGIDIGIAHRRNELSQVPLAFVDIVRRAYPDRRR